MCASPNVVGRATAPPLTSPTWLNFTIPAQFVGVKILVAIDSACYSDEKITKIRRRSLVVKKLWPPKV